MGFRNKIKDFLRENVLGLVQIYICIKGLRNFGYNITFFGKNL